MTRPITFFNCPHCDKQTFGYKRHDAIECIACKHVKMLPEAQKTASKIRRAIQWGIDNEKEADKGQKE